jgi:methylated-DNA-[protein]-cysteine S-methyltransferase
MNRKKVPDRQQAALAAWLGDEKATGETPAWARRLDAVFAKGPSPEAEGRAMAALSRRLEAARGAPVFYDRIASTPVGALWVAVSERGLVAVEFGTPEQEFRRRVERRVRARVRRAGEPTDEARRQVMEYLSGARTQFSLPVDLHFLTAFQQSVLQAAQAVPRGKVSTYGQIARRIGRPKAARAVGQALGSNPVPIVIPCHRVLASDGRLGGYSGRGGIRTKEKLLRLEGALEGRWSVNR